MSEERADGESAPRRRRKHTPLPLEILRQVAAELYLSDDPTSDELKALAARIRRTYGVRCQVDDVLALSRSHDPFYVIPDGSREQLAHWFVDTVVPLGIRLFGTVDDVHHRRLHYTLGTTGAPNHLGEPYRLSTPRSVLSSASSAARALGLLDDVRLADHRHRDALGHLYAMREPPQPEIVADGEGWVERLPTISAPSDTADSDAGSFRAEGYEHSHADEATGLYVIVEKSTVDDVLEPVCEALGITFVPQVGISSNVFIEALIDKIEGEGRPARIGYVADLDAGGGVMPRHVSRMIQHARATGRLTVDVALDRIALTWEQVITHRIPLADKDLGDRRQWDHPGRVELDALVVVAPTGTLEGIVRDWAEPYRSGELRAELADAEAEADETVEREWDDHTERWRRRAARLDSIRRRVIARHAETFALLDTYNADAERVARLVERLDGELDELVASFDPTLPERPEPDEVLDDVSGWLFDSERSYLDQLVAFRELNVADANGSEEDEQRDD